MLSSVEICVPAKGPKQNHLGLLPPLILARVAAQGKGKGFCLAAALEGEPGVLIPRVCPWGDVFSVEIFCSRGRTVDSLIAVLAQLYFDFYFAN